METIDLVSAIASVIVVGVLIMHGGLMANATLIAEVLRNRRPSARERRTFAANAATAQR